MNDEPAKNIGTGSDGSGGIKTEYELRREAKEREEKVRGRQHIRRKTVVTACVVVGIILIVWLILSAMKGKGPTGEDLSHACPDTSREHIAIGAPHSPYQSNPPCGGPHYPQTARKTFYESAVPDEYVIHNLEHGDVWIAYHPRVSAEAKAVLKKLLLPKIIITPREANTEDVAVVAWGRVDTFNLEGGELPADRIKDFVTRYRNKGPEQVPVGMDTNTFN